MAGGARRVRDAFTAANHDVEEAVFMGDATWWCHIRPLAGRAAPAARNAWPEAAATWQDPAWRHDEVSAPTLALTRDGESVLAGEADLVALNGIDRWLGGVHVTTNSLWRWDNLT